MAKQPGLDNRHRDNDGQAREKNSTTRVDTLRETYGDDFAPGIRGDAHLSTLLKRTGSRSLSDYLRKGEQVAAFLFPLQTKTGARRSA